MLALVSHNNLEFGSADTFRNAGNIDVVLSSE